MSNIIENMTKTIQLVQEFFSNNTEKWKIVEMKPHSNKDMMLIKVLLSNGNQTEYKADLATARILDTDNKLLFEGTRQ